MTRSHRVFLSCGTVCKSPEWEGEESLFHFGTSGSPVGSGFNLEFSVDVHGSIDKESGTIISSEEMHRLLWYQAQKIDHQFVDDSWPEFHTSPPTLENILLFLSEGLYQSLAESYSDLKLIRSRLKSGDHTWVDFFWSQENKVFFTRTYKIPAVHRHHNPDLSQLENKKIYGKCSTMHGHEYSIEVTVKGPKNNKNGLVWSRGEMDQSVKKLLVDPFSGILLNDKIGNTSGEIITIQWSKILRQAWGERFSHLVVRETRKNSFVESTHRIEEGLFLL